MQLSLASAVALSLGGGLLVAMEPGWQRAGFSRGATSVWQALGRAFLDGALPTEPAARDMALQGLVERLHVAVLALPEHAQHELSQLLMLLSTAVGRRTLAGLSTDWPQASIPELHAALQDMRSSRVSLRVQSYLALHDLVGVAYFSDPSTWTVLDYPGPLVI